VSIKDNAKNIEINRGGIEALEKGFKLMEKELTQDRLDNAIFQTDVKNGLKDLSTIKYIMLTLTIAAIIGVSSAVAKALNWI